MAPMAKSEPAAATSQMSGPSDLSGVVPCGVPRVSGVTAAPHACFEHNGKRCVWEQTPFAFSVRLQFAQGVFPNGPSLSAKLTMCVLQRNAVCVVRFA